MSCAACCVSGEPGKRLTRISFDSCGTAQVCVAPDGLEMAAGGWFVVGTGDGERVGRAASFSVPVLPTCGDRAVGTVLRPATDGERDRAQQLAIIGRDAIAFCRTRAGELGLAMRPVAAVLPLDRDTLLMTFAADERVDFRELLRDLGRRTRRRVELRQVGVRDQARVAGGWGPCGRALCCATFMARFNSVTIRMAKAQNLSLSPSRISGMCGRLMCCLAHEAHETAGRRKKDTSA